MSAPVRDSDVPAQGEKIREMAAEWLVRRSDGENWSDDDQLQLDRWLAESPAHVVAYWRLEEVWGHADRLGALRRPTRDKSPDEIARRPFRGAFKGVAALHAFRSVENADNRSLARQLGLKCFEVAPKFRLGRFESPVADQRSSAKMPTGSVSASQCGGCGQQPWRIRLVYQRDTPVP